MYNYYYHHYFALSFQSINWNIVAALAAVVAAIAALITVGILVWQTRYTLKIQTLNQMLDSWQSPPIFPKIRQKAAKIIWNNLFDQTKFVINQPAAAVALSNQIQFDLDLEHEDTSHIDAVLDFFETIALFVRKGVLDFEQVYSAFSWAMSCYWLATRKYILDARNEEGDELWEEYVNMMPRIQQRERKNITIANAKGFFYDEQSLTYNA